MKHTTDTIKGLLTTSNAAVEKGLLVIYARQTTEEQAIGTTKNVNGRGFSAFDAEILSSFACQVEKKVSEGKKLGECLSPKQMELARKKMARYARQLAEVANDKAQEVKPSEIAPVAPVAAEKASFSYWLLIRGEQWQEISQERASRWYERMVKLARFYKVNTEFLPFEKAEAGKFWTNHASDMLQVLKAGEEPKRIKGLELEREMWEMEAKGDREQTLREESAKAEWKVSVESINTITPEPLSEAVYGDDPRGKYASIKANIKAWASN